MLDAQWFQGAKLNFAKNLLRKNNADLAIIFYGEDKVRREITFWELYDKTTRLALSLKALGVGAGDRVAAFMPNMPETVIAMLATASLGAVFSSCSPDFGVSGVLDRFGQIEPKILFSADGYFHKGKVFDSLEKVKELQKSLPSVIKTIIAPYTQHSWKMSGERGQTVLFEDFLLNERLSENEFYKADFNHPLYIMYSSGTTGKPKCIVHGTGGTLIEHLKEHRLHTDIKEHDRFFYQTTCGWMMWNWLVSGLASGATLILYDGAPFLKGGRILFEMCEKEKVNIFGTNAKFLAALEKEGLNPGAEFDLSALKTILSTGSVLAPQSFEWVYKAIKQDVCLSSISGGTDILGCFALGWPLMPVRKGELQCRSLGLKVEVYNDSGLPVTGEKGELVCTAPFPSMPIYFWDDKDNCKYKAAYFKCFQQNVWCHGDFVELTPEGGMIFYGRSDSTLNPGGIRIGTAEVYRQVEKIPDISESLVIGQNWDDDIRIVLFITLAEGKALTEEVKLKIKSAIRQNTSPFHVPAKIIAISDIPRTRSGKIVELAVRSISNREEIKNAEAIANPEALEEIKNKAELFSE